MKLEEAVRRLEVVALSLERIAARMPPDGSGPERGVDGDHVGEEPNPSPQALTDAEVDAAEKLIEKQIWEAETLARVWAQKGGPTDEDAEEYLRSWATKP